MEKRSKAFAVASSHEDTTPLILLGAGGMARELFSLFKWKNPERPIILVDDVTEVQSVQVLDMSVDVVKDWVFPAGFKHFVVAVGDPRQKVVFVEKALAKGLHSAPFQVGLNPLISPDAVLGRGGTGMSLVLETKVQVRDYVSIHGMCAIGHDTILHDYVTLGPRVSLLGGCEVGRGAVLGAHAVVREGTKIGEGAVVGMGAAVVKDVPPFTRVLGVPAKPG